MWFCVSPKLGAAAAEVPDAKLAEPTASGKEVEAEDDGGDPQEQAEEAEDDGGDPQEQAEEAEDDGGDPQEQAEEEVPQESDIIMCIEDGKKPTAGAAQDVD